MTKATEFDKRGEGSIFPRPTRHPFKSAVHFRKVMESYLTGTKNSRYDFDRYLKQFEKLAVSFLLDNGAKAVADSDSLKFMKDCPAGFAWHQPTGHPLYLIPENRPYAVDAALDLLTSCFVSKQQVARQDLNKSHVAAVGLSLGMQVIKFSMLAGGVESLYYIGKRQQGIGRKQASQLAEERRSKFSREKLVSALEKAWQRQPKPNNDDLNQLAAKSLKVSESTIKRYRRDWQIKSHEFRK